MNSQEDFEGLALSANLSHLWDVKSNPPEFDSDDGYNVLKSSSEDDDDDYDDNLLVSQESSETSSTNSKEDESHRDPFRSRFLDPKKPSKYVDSHAHLHWLFNKENFKGSFAEFREQNRDTFPKGFDGCVNVFCNPDDFSDKRCYEELLNDKLVYGAFGCHPRKADMYGPEQENHLLQRLQHHKVVALGEIGLDYSNKVPNPEIQKSVFLKQLRIAKDRNLPIVIHSRDSDADALKILKEQVHHNHLIHRHCYTGDWKNLHPWISHFPNLFVGFTNLITSPNVTHLHKVVERIPLERILLETDSPFFLPYNIQIEANYKYSNPGMAMFVASKIASFRPHDTIEDVFEAARENTKKIYGF